MKIKIHRGENQIGGSIIEIATLNTKILLDVGAEITDDKEPELPEVEGLFDYKGYDAVFLSHYHADHIGLAGKIYKDIPIYIGGKAFSVMRSLKAVMSLG